MSPNTEEFSRASMPAGDMLDSFGRHHQAILIARWGGTEQDTVGNRFVVSDRDRYFRLTFGWRVRRGIDIFAVVDRASSLPT